MNPRAIELSQQKYVTIVRREPLSDDEFCYTARHPEFPSCLAQGSTPDEAKAELVEATQMIIDHLLENGLPVPVPMTSQQACNVLTEEELPEQKPAISIKALTPGVELVFST